MKYGIICCLFLTACASDFRTIISELPPVVSAELNTKDSAQLWAVTFFDIDCPISLYTIKPLNEIQATFGSQLRVVAVMPGNHYSQPDIDSFLVQNELNFPLLKDEKLKLVRKLDATITPEVFLFQNANKLLYQGAVDDKYQGLGKSKPMPNTDFLSEAIHQFTYGQKITTAKTQAVGCIIER